MTKIGRSGKVLGYARRQMLAIPRRLALAVLLVVLSLAAAPMVGAPRPQSQPVASSFSATAAKQHVEALADRIGSRPTGSASYDQAVAYAADQFRQWGYEPLVQTFPVASYDDRGSELELLSGGGGRITADTLVYSVAGEVRAPLIAAGLGQPEDFAAIDARGKIALLKRGTLRFSDKVSNAAAAGAVGVVVYNDVSGRVQGSLGQAQPVPAVTISAEDGQLLLAAMVEGAV
ncbi:MAG: hypothetical protein M3336_03265, partial [Chloroflexota bacterium]|nr:hypothetical protein [Chloroflexota bacterium]